MPNPPPIDGDLVAYLGELARLSVPPERQKALRDKLQALVESFSSLDAADFGELDDAGPSGARSTPDTLRRDLPEAVPGTDEVLRNAPQTAADSFVVPRVVEP